MKETQWFIEPIGEPTNSAIVNELERRFLDSAPQELETDRGKVVTVYATIHPMIQHMENSRALKGYRFRTYTRTGRFNPLRLWTFGRKKQASAKTKAILTALAEIQARLK